MCRFLMNTPRTNKGVLAKIWKREKGESGLRKVKARNVEPGYASAFPLGIEESA